MLWTIVKLAFVIFTIYAIVGYVCESIDDQ